MKRTFEHLETSVSVLPYVGEFTLDLFDQDVPIIEPFNPSNPLPANAT